MQNKKRDERHAEKKRAEDDPAPQPSSGGTLAAIPQEPAALEQSDEEYSRVAFEKLWSTNQAWTSLLLEDALSYTKSFEPNDQTGIDKALRKGPVTSADISSQFASNIWPSLKTRGWKASILSEGDNAGRRCYEFGERKVSDFLIQQDRGSIEYNLTNPVTVPRRRFGASGSHWTSS